MYTKRHFGCDENDLNLEAKALTTIEYRLELNLFMGIDIHFKRAFFPNIQTNTRFNRLH